MAATLLLAAGCLLTSCTDDPSGSPGTSRSPEGVRLVLSSADDEGDTLHEADTTVRRGDLYSFTSRMVCLTEPGVVRITGAELDPGSTGLEIVDVRVRRPAYGGWGSLKGTLDRLPFTANPGNEVRTLCERFGGTDDPPMDETGLTVRRTAAAPGRVSKIRFLYAVGGREEKTDWFYHQWTLGPG